jgi:ABC-type multidrug transport system fused ATPase/permease subunit
MYASNQILWEPFFAFIIFSIFVGASLGSFPEIISQFQQTAGATERLREILDMQGERKNGKTDITLKGQISLENVSFSYPSRPEITTLSDVSLHIPAGQRTAIVGPSGAGKSTLFSLILGFNDPASGSIRFDGTDAHDISLDCLRSQIAIVPQEVMLFGGTISENIAYGRPGASASEIENAAKLANAHDFIAELPSSYETLVGPRGTKLSGGQRQRIAIARAILADPKILLLDEATSALDSESERLVNEALERLMKNRTSLVIAHRLSTVRHADQILVISKGKLVEQGTHDNLYSANGTYRFLAETQLS